MEPVYFFLPFLFFFLLCFDWAVAAAVAVAVAAGGADAVDWAVAVGAVVVDGAVAVDWAGDVPVAGDVVPPCSYKESCNQTHVSWMQKCSWWLIQVRSQCSALLYPGLVDSGSERHWIIQTEQVTLPVAVVSAVRTTQICCWWESQHSDPFTS